MSEEEEQAGIPSALNQLSEVVERGGEESSYLFSTPLKILLTRMQPAPFN